MPTATLNAADDRPFLLAALERNPVALAATQAMSDAALAAQISALPDEIRYTTNPKPPGAAD